MQVQQISAVSNARNQQPANFKARLKLTFPTSSISHNINRGECDFAEVISRFREWLSWQNPVSETLTISKKFGKMVDQMKVRGAGGVFMEKHPENLEFSMNGAKCGFCWNEQSTENRALEDFKNTFNYVKKMAGY